MVGRRHPFAGFSIIGFTPKGDAPMHNVYTNVEDR